MEKDLRAVIFDLDDTLAPSKSPIDPSMAELLLHQVPVCIISGGCFEQFHSPAGRRFRPAGLGPPR